MGPHNRETSHMLHASPGSFLVFGPGPFGLGALGCVCFSARSSRAADKELMCLGREIRRRPTLGDRFVTGFASPLEGVDITSFLPWHPTCHIPIGSMFHAFVVSPWV